MGALSQSLYHEGRRLSIGCTTLLAKKPELNGVDSNATLATSHFCATHPWTTYPGSKAGAPFSAGPARHYLLDRPN
jgi:hypothetical protein